jgi:hypothetical protein
VVRGRRAGCLRWRGGAATAADAGQRAAAGGGVLAEGLIIAVASGRQQCFAWWRREGGTVGGCWLGAEPSKAGMMSAMVMFSSCGDSSFLRW